MSKEITTLVFDAYGTLFDVYSVGALAEQLFPGKGPAVTQLWRAKQLEYTWLRSLMGRYETFDRITGAAWTHATTTLGLNADAAAIEKLVAAFQTLTPHSEVRDALDKLAVKRPLNILSNGTPSMLHGLLAHHGMSDRFNAVLSVDEVGIYKPHPKVYQLVLERFGVTREQVGFVSSNCWDACGATAFGFTTFWINRAQTQLDGLGAVPKHQLRLLSDMLPLLD